MSLTSREKERYNRHIILQDIGIQGQEKIKDSRVLVVGAGGLGSPVLYYLAAAGIGHIGIMDDDIVSESNLQRQILYDTTNVGTGKATVAATKLCQLNPFCGITPYTTRLTDGNALEIIAAYDIVVDATDNLYTRYLINDACVLLGKPFVYGSIREFEGQLSVFNYHDGPTYRDLFEYHDEVKNFSQPLGVIGALPGIIGSLQANEVIKIILEKTGVLSGKLLTLDIMNNTYLTFNIRKKEGQHDSLLKIENGELKIEN